MAGVVPKGTLAARQKEVQASDPYPWKSVVDRILQGPMAPEHRRKRLAVRGKTVLAWLLSRSIFFGLYTLAVCAMLILVKQLGAEWDIYIVLKWLQQAFPGVFPPA